jgi:large-conductance mechanosensitive channel
MNYISIVFINRFLLICCAVFIVLHQVIKVKTNLRKANQRQVLKQ